MIEQCLAPRVQHSCNTDLGLEVVFAELQERGRSGSEEQIIQFGVVLLNERIQFMWQRENEMKVSIWSPSGIHTDQRPVERDMASGVHSADVRDGDDSKWPVGIGDEPPWRTTALPSFLLSRRQPLFPAHRTVKLKVAPHRRHDLDHRVTSEPQLPQR